MKTPTKTIFLTLTLYACCYSTVTIGMFNKGVLTPLHIAVLQKNFQQVRILVENGANLYKRDKYGRRPIDIKTSEPIKNYFIVVEVIRKAIQQKMSFENFAMQYLSESRTNTSYTVGLAPTSNSIFAYHLYDWLKENGYITAKSRLYTNVDSFFLFLACKTNDVNQQQMWLNKFFECYTDKNNALKPVIEKFINKKLLDNSKNSVIKEKCSSRLKKKLFKLRDQNSDLKIFFVTRNQKSTQEP